MTLDQLCKKAGVEIFDCGPGWGGRFGIRTKTSKGSTCGFRTKRSAQIGYVKETCGELAPIVLRLLEKDPPQ